MTANVNQPGKIRPHESNDGESLRGDELVQFAYERVLLRALAITLYPKIPDPAMAA